MILSVKISANVKNSGHNRKSKNICLQEGEILVSLDICFLIPSPPIFYALQLPKIVFNSLEEINY